MKRGRRQRWEPPVSPGRKRKPQGWTRCLLILRNTYTPYLSIAQAASNSERGCVLLLLLSYLCPQVTSPMLYPLWERFAHPETNRWNKCCFSAGSAQKSLQAIPRLMLIINGPQASQPFSNKSCSVGIYLISYFVLKFPMALSSILCVLHISAPARVNAVLYYHRYFFQISRSALLISKNPIQVQHISVFDFIE